jgi:hypothetical protein
VPAATTNESPSNLLSLENRAVLLLHSAQDEDSAGETKGSLTSGSEWSRHTLARTFHVVHMMPSAERWKNRMYRHGDKTYVGTDR